MNMTAPKTVQLAEDHASPPAAIVKAPQTDDVFRFALEPEGFREAREVAAMIAKTGICKIESPEDAMVRMMCGRSLGIPTFIALQHVYQVEGRPSLSAKLKVALCMRHPDCEYFEIVESDNTHAVYRAKRRGREEKKVRFDIEQAKTAGLVKPNSNWEKWPRRMCQARASGELADVVFPDACMGMPSVEESYDERDTARANEMTGEVVTVAKPSPAQAGPARDFESEVAILKHRVANAKTDAEKKGVRDDVKAFADSAGEPWAKDIKDHYNAAVAKPKKDAAPVAATASTTAPAAVGDDLFGPAR